MINRVSDRRARVSRVRDALVLRDALLRYLSSPRDARAVDGLLVATPAAWALLLRLECCALPLVARLRADGVLDRLEAKARACLASAEAAEMQRVLAARLLVRDLDVIGERSGVRFTVLKGGALAADATRQPVDLGDVDVLTAPESTEQAWQALLANGWSPRPSGLTPIDALGERPHYAPLVSQRHQLPLELHARFEYGLPPAHEGEVLSSTPMAGYRTIERLAGVRAIAATLRHSVVVHPHRRGHLRDLFLLTELLRELDDREMNALERELRGDIQSIELLAMLAQARALSRGEPLADPPALRPFVAFKYAVEERTSRLLGIGSPGWNTWSHVVLERPVVRRVEYRRLLREGSEPIRRDWSPLGHPVLASRVGRSLGLPRLVRVARRVGLVLALVAAGGAIRRHVATLDRAERG